MAEQHNGPSDWGICAMVKERPEVLRTFVAHHLDLGARWIRLYFDDPDDPMADQLAGLDRVEAIRCTDAHWQRLAPVGRPDISAKRQKLNARHAYADAPVSWLIHIDGDELIHPQIDLAAALAAVPRERMTVRVAPVERMISPNGGPEVYRRVLEVKKGNTDLRKRLYGDYRKYLRMGMMSHTAGKFFVRTGVRGLQMSVHGPFRDGARILDFDTLDDVLLLHRHALDFDHWFANFEHRMTYAGYMAVRDRRTKHRLHDLLAELWQTRGKDGLRHFFDTVHNFTGETAEILDAEDLVVRVTLDLDAVVARYFPNQASARPA